MRALRPLWSVWQLRQGCGFLSPVVAGALTHVLPHFLVAVHAQPVLRRAVEAHVALARSLRPTWRGPAPVARPQHRLDVLRQRRRQRKPRSNRHASSQRISARRARGSPWRIRSSRSVGVHGDHVHDGTDDQQVDEGQVGHVPQREHAFVGAVLGDAHHGVQVLVDQPARPPLAAVADSWRSSRAWRPARAEARAARARTAGRSIHCWIGSSVTWRKCVIQPACACSSRCSNAEQTRLDLRAEVQARACLVFDQSGTVAQVAQRSPFAVAGRGGRARR